MALSLQDKMISTGPAVYYEEDWRILIETHLLYLQQEENYSLININPHLAFKYEGDLWGLLIDQGVEMNIHFIVMRINDLFSPADYTQDMLTLKIPSTNTVDELRQIYQTVSAKTN